MYINWSVIQQHFQKSPKSPSPSPILSVLQRWPASMVDFDQTLGSVNFARYNTARDQAANSGLETACGCTNYFTEPPWVATKQFLLYSQVQPRRFERHQNMAPQNPEDKKEETPNRTRKNNVEPGFRTSFYDFFLPSVLLLSQRAYCY